MITTRSMSNDANSPARSWSVPVSAAIAAVVGTTVYLLRSRREEAPDALGKFAKEVEIAAAEVDVPAWAREDARPECLKDVQEWRQGPRPSDVCIAKHYETDWQGRPVELEPVQVRAWREDPELYSYERLPALPAAFAAKKISANSVPCVWANWPGVESVADGVVLYMHGGANIFNSAEGDINHAARLSQLFGQRVLSVDYRRAPEHPLPASTLDVVAAYEWLLGEGGYAPAQVALCGFSSGGMSVVLALQEIKRRQLPMPACGVPVSAFHQHSDDLEYRTARGTILQQIWQMNCGNLNIDGEPTGSNADVNDATYSFLSGDFSGLPPLYVLVGGQEQLCDLNTSLRLAAKAKQAGVDVTLDIAAYLQHCPIGQDVMRCPEDAACAFRVASFLRRVMGKLSPCIIQSKP